MTQTYFKRYRMEVSLRGLLPPPQIPAGYRLLGWDECLIDAHADVKYRSFRDEVDAQVFPCLGEEAGCRRLMGEISQKLGFAPSATWLAGYAKRNGPLKYCGTVQGIQDDYGFGGIQNLGVTPEHRGHGLGACLLHQALKGFQREGARSVYLEVTARNASAIRLYRNFGFRHVKTVYKSVDVSTGRVLNSS